MEKILYCDSRGDKRFSAFYAKVIINNQERSIEDWYQSAKRTADGSIPGKGKPVDHLEWFGVIYDVTYLSNLYLNLWKLYFFQHQDLLEVAAQYDVFIDRFKGSSVNNQGDAIAQIVASYKTHKEDKDADRDEAIHN